MSFSFNWAGLNMPSVSFNKAVDDQDFGKNLGLAARGYDNRQAAEDYADKIDTFRMSQNAKAMSDKTSLAALQSELKQLKMSNAEIDEKIKVAQAKKDGQYAQPTVQTDAQANSLTDDELQALMFNPETATRDEIKLMQGMVGTKADGAWGPKSKAAWDAKYGYLLDTTNGLILGGY